MKVTYNDKHWLFHDYASSSRFLSGKDTTGMSHFFEASPPNA
jgi:hypothetical protein